MSNTKSPRPRCSALLPASFMKGRPEGQCRKRATGTIETLTGWTEHPPVCSDPACAEWIRAGYWVRRGDTVRGGIPQR